ncbi:hypothetical protein FQZ97_808660 [compost metagenome]
MTAETRSVSPSSDDARISRLSASLPAKDDAFSLRMPPTVSLIEVRSSLIFVFVSSIMVLNAVRPPEKVSAISRVRAMRFSLIWRERVSRAALSFSVLLSSAWARVSNSVRSERPRSLSVVSSCVRRASNSLTIDCVAPPSKVAIPAVRSSSAELTRSEMSRDC